MTIYGCRFATKDTYVSEWGFKTQEEAIEKLNQYKNALARANEKTIEEIFEK